MALFSHPVIPILDQRLRRHSSSPADNIDLFDRVLTMFNQMREIFDSHREVSRDRRTDDDFEQNTALTVVQIMKIVLLLVMFVEHGTMFLLACRRETCEQSRS